MLSKRKPYEINFQTDCIPFIGVIPYLIRVKKGLKQLVDLEKEFNNYDNQVEKRLFLLATYNVIIFNTLETFLY